MKKLSQTGLPWLLIAFFVFLFDILSKFLVIKLFDLHEGLKIVPFFSFTYVRNYGAAFSFFWEQRIMLVAVAICISCFILYLIYKNPKSEWLSSFALSLVFGGALGNLIDRIYHGFVIDFLDFSFWDWHFPTFNVADISIFCGACLLIYYNFLKDK